VDKLRVVLSGGLRVTQLSEDGSALTIAVLGEGSYFGAGSLVKEGEIVKAEAHAVGRTQVAVFGVAQLEREFSSERVMDHHRMELLYRRLLASIDLARDVLAVPLPQRMARRGYRERLVPSGSIDADLWRGSTRGSPHKTV